MSTHPSSVDQLISSLGPASADIEWIGFDAEAHAWSVRYAGDAEVLMEWCDPQQCLMVQVSLGRPPSSEESVVHKAVLAYNALWQENGGTRVGMVDPDGELALMFELPTESLTVDRLQEVLSVMRLQATGWTGFVANPGGVQGSGAIAASSAFASATQRV